MAWDDDYYPSSIDPRIAANPYMNEAAGLRIQQEYLDQQRRQQQDSQGPARSGKGSWYSQLPEAGWIDKEDKPRSNALGVPDSQQGIALPSRSTLGQWFDVKAPNGETYRLQQTDIGPFTRTGRGIDISAAAAHQMGYTPKDFPTNGSFTWAPASGPPTDAMASGSPAGPPVQADEMGSVAGPYGRPRMDDTSPPGLFDLIQQRQGQQQQASQGGGGLFGGLGGLIGAIDPQKMAYLGMIAKGLDPYSSINPDAMLKLAQQSQSDVQDRMLRQQQLGLNTRAQDRADFMEDRRQREYDTKQAREDAARQGAIELFGGASPGGAPTSAPPGQTAMTRENIHNYFRKFPEAQDSPTGKMLLRHLEKLDAQEEERGKLDRGVADRTRIADQGGLTGAQRQEYIYGVKDQDKSIPAGESGRLAIADIYLKRAPQIAEQIDKGNLTGPYDVTMGKLGVGQQGMVMGDMKSGVDALRRMLTGQGMPASEAAEYTQRYEPTYKDTVTTLKYKHERLVEELTAMRDNIMRGRGSTPAPSQGGSRPAPGGAPADPLGIR